MLPATIEEFVLVINTMKLYLSPNLDFPLATRFLVWEELVYDWQARLKKTAAKEAKKDHFADDYSLKLKSNQTMQKERNESGTYPFATDAYLPRIKTYHFM